MKFALFAVLAFAAVANSFVLLPEEGLQLDGNVIDNLVKEAAEFIRKLLKQNEPYALPEVGEQTIVDTDVNIKVTLTGVKISKADDFDLKDAESNLPNLSAKFELVAPSPHLEGNFQISGTAFTKTVSGSGTFSVDLTNMDQRGNVQLGLKDHGVLIQSLDLDYDLNGAKFAFTGLNIEGMTEEQVNDFMNKQLLNTLNQNKAEVCKKVAAQIVEKGNALVAGKSLKELIEWLKNVIHQ
ncbi:Hypothetical protein NTJ_01250 [Nesidiocoris tenuis]|uniref:Lipid-binding serum glycoprotein N-terminal domain-containing protein n=1 Tax=Nesidiocoris tenuis TaxID=355587 RepID=A0ABN7AAY9_9HEMI|nr:Hypothetical protein NTJ_01250 [Nesidiocoris tenuis]